MLTTAEIAKRVTQGELLAIGEYRHSKAEMINWRDKQTGRGMSAPVLRHTVEFGNVTIAVSERVPDGTKIEDIKVPWTKGQTVALHLDELTRAQGMVAAKGTLEAVSPGNGAPVGTAQTPR